MLWSQYKLAMIRRTEFLHKEITRIPNIANRNSNFPTLQTLEFQKKNPTGIFGIKHGIRIPLTVGVPEIGTKNWNSQPSSSLIRMELVRLQMESAMDSHSKGQRDPPNI